MSWATGFCVRKTTFSCSGIQTWVIAIIPCGRNSNLSNIVKPNVAVYKTSPYLIQEQPPISDKNDAWHITLLQSWISLQLQLHSNPLPLIYSPTLQLCLDKLRGPSCIDTELQGSRVKRVGLRVYSFIPPCTFCFL
jgi:hypothetical protein